MALAVSSSRIPSSEQDLFLRSVASPSLPYSTSEQLTAENQRLKDELATLKQQNHQLNRLIDVMPTGMVMLDGNGIVIKVNDIARQLLDEPILGQAWFDVIKRSFKPRADDWHEVSLKDGRRVKLEIRAMDNQPGQLITITDLTETRLLQDKLSQLQRLSSLGRMVSSLAHQIRTPLSSAMLYGANLASNKLSAGDRKGFQEKLMSRLCDLEQQVNDMLLFAKSGNQQMVEELSVNELVRRAVGSMDALINKHQAQVKVHSAHSDGFILGNFTALSGAIQNLLDNSIQIIKRDAKIDVSIHFQAGSAYICVQDNGPGIAAEFVDKIFEPFVTSRAQGTGLGLAVVKAVANAHHGDVQLLSQPGDSAHICIKLPLVHGQQDHDAKRSLSSLEATDE